MRSTFSWWSAYLNLNAGQKRIIAPSPWTGKRAIFTKTQGLLPSHWTILRYDPHDPPVDIIDLIILMVMIVILVKLGQKVVNNHG